ncbi:hypothetical protein SAMD00019534_095480, partial [Acytostelium subglobosum LB1]|uniref:hypothetical protein n=1 Tax=Acytostelium subglobosum LB1 TaxID=1410327 RepID=UPI000644E91B
MAKTATIIVSLVCYVVIVMGVVTFGSETPNFPRSFPTTYSTFISYNNYENGFTVAHKEYTNAKINMTRFESGNVTIVDLSRQVIYQYNARDDRICNQFNSINEALFNPSYLLIPILLNLTESSDNIPSFQNYTTIDRGINCTLFTTTKVTSTSSSIISGVSINGKVNVTAANQFNTTCFPGAKLLPTDDTANISAICTITNMDQVSCTFSNATDITKSTCIFVVDNPNELKQLALDSKLLFMQTKDVTTTNNNTKYVYLDSAAKVPIRIFISSVTSSEDQPISSLFSIDWIDWVTTTDQQSSIFTPPSHCTASDFTNPFLLPKSKNLGQSPTTVDNISPAFSLLLEEEMNHRPVNSIFWSMDARYQTIEQDNESGGDTITILDADTLSNFSINSFSLQCISPVSNPFTNDPRRFPIYRILAQQHLPALPWTLVGRSTHRSIDVDIYNATINASPDGITLPYNYTVIMKMVAPGWKFPGSYGINSDSRIPLAIESTYQADNETGVDRWDFYLFTPESVPKSYYSLDGQSCYPKIPAQYNATVFANYGDVGASYYYNESFDAVQGFYYTVGKFAGPSDIGLVNYTDNTFSIMNGAATSSCTTYNISSLTGSLQPSSAPSVNYLQPHPKMGPMTLYGNHIIYQNYNTSIWSTTTKGLPYFDVAHNKTMLANANYKYYWRVADSGWVPFRVETEYFVMDADVLINTFTISLEWISFNPVAQNLSSLPTPQTSNCVASNDSAVPLTNYLPERTFTLPPLLKETHQPLLASSFSALVEINQKSYSADHAYSSRRTLIQWEYDVNTLAEFFKVYYPDGTSNNFTFCYLHNMGIGMSFYSLNGNPFHLVNTPLKLNPLGEGTILSRVIYNQTSYLKSAKLNPMYSYLSGIPAENWTTDGSGTDNFVSMFWYPYGWQFPSNAQSQRVPMGISHEENNDKKKYFETWEFLQFHNTLAGPQWAQVCYNATKESPSIFNQGLSTRVIAIIIAVCTLSTMFIGVAIFCFIKSREAKDVPHHVLLEERSDMRHQLNNNDDDADDDSSSSD